MLSLYAFLFNQMVCFCWNWYRHLLKMASFWIIPIFLPKVVFVGNAGKSFCLLAILPCGRPAAHFCEQSKPWFLKGNALHQQSLPRCKCESTGKHLGRRQRFKDEDDFWLQECLALLRERLMTLWQHEWQHFLLLRAIFVHAGLHHINLCWSVGLWSVSSRSGAFDWHPIHSYV